MEKVCRRGRCCRWDNGCACRSGFTFRCRSAAPSAVTAISPPTCFRARFSSATWIGFVPTSRTLRRSRLRWAGRWNARSIPSTSAEGRRPCSRRGNWSGFLPRCALSSNVRPDAEVTVECAPGTLTPAMLESLLRCGVNRVSLGVQSFVDQEAAAVGRLHKRATVLEDIARLRDCRNYEYQYRSDCRVAASDS